MSRLEYQLFSSENKTVKSHFNSCCSGYFVSVVLCLEIKEQQQTRTCKSVETMTCLLDQIFKGIQGAERGRSSEIYKGTYIPNSHSFHLNKWELDA